MNTPSGASISTMPSTIRSEAAHGIVTQMLVINRVVLQIVEQADQIVRFGNEHAVGREHFHDALHDQIGGCPRYSDADARDKPCRIADRRAGRSDSAIRK